MIKRRLENLEEQTPIDDWVAGDALCRKDGSVTQPTSTIEDKKIPVIAKILRRDENT